MIGSTQRAVVPSKRSVQARALALKISPCEVDELDDAVDHGVAHRDQRIQGTEGQAVDQLLQQFGHVCRNHLDEFGQDGCCRPWPNSVSG